MIRAFRQFNKAPLLKTLAAAATLPTTHDPTTTTNPSPPRRNRNNRGRHQRGVQHQAAGGSAGLPFPPEFEAFVARARHGLNRVLRGLPDALTGPLAMLLRLPGAFWFGGVCVEDGSVGAIAHHESVHDNTIHKSSGNAGAVETASKLEHVVVQLERQTNESFTLVWNRCVQRPSLKAFLSPSPGDKFLLPVTYIHTQYTQPTQLPPRRGRGAGDGGGPGRRRRPPKPRARLALRDPRGGARWVIMMMMGSVFAVVCVLIVIT